MHGISLEKLISFQLHKANYFVKFHCVYKCINVGVDMHLITQTLKAYVPLSQSCPVQPVVHEQVFGATQCPPFWHGELQTAVIQSNNFSNSHNITLCSCT